MSFLQSPRRLARPCSPHRLWQQELTRGFLTEQAGVGLMLGENSEGDGSVVKQLVPKGAAERTGKVRCSRCSLFCFFSYSFCLTSVERLKGNICPVSRCRSATSYYRLATWT